MADLADPIDPDLEAAVWDLAPLVNGEGDDGARRLLTEARRRAGECASRYAGRVSKLKTDELVSAVNELDVISDLLQRGRTYAELRAYSDSADPAGGVLQGAFEAAQSEVDTQLLFFDLEWIALDDVRAEEVLTGAGGRLDFAAHHLRRLRARRAYLLSPGEERILAETGVQRLAAWKRLYTESTAILTAEVDGGTMPLAQAMSLLDSPDRTKRLAAIAGIGEGARAGLSTRVAAYNQVLGEKAVVDRLRGYPTWLSSRNLANETTDASVDALLSAVTARRDIPRRWNRLKAQLLGIDRLTTCDLMAPLAGDARRVAYRESQAIITSAWAAASPRAGAIIEGFFTGARIDAPIRANKQGGAFCSPAGPGQSPYILVNYDSRPTETGMLAHELGHGLHFELARACSALHYDCSIPIAEFPSTFSEALVTEHQLTQADDGRARLSLLATRLDAAMMNVFMSCSYLAAEARLHSHRREQGELSAEDMIGIWNAEHVELWGDTVEIQDGFSMFWSLFPHMIWEPGYFYSYAYGLLTAWSAFARYKQIGPGFVEDYLAMLAAGGSRSPAELLAMIGLDLEDPDYWNTGLNLLEEMLTEAERLAAAL